MNTQNSTIEYTLNAVRRQIADEIPELTLHFILHEGEDKTVETKTLSASLPDHPAAEKMATFLKEHPPTTTELSGIAIHRHKPLPLFRTKESYLAVCQVHIPSLLEEAALIFPDAPDKYERIVGYGLAWRVLYLMDRHKAGKTEYDHDKDLVLQPRQDTLHRLRRNLLSECFAVMYMEQQGEQGTILQLMKKRCETIVEKNTGFKPEIYPYPITIDATRLIYEELRNTSAEQSHIFRHTMEMVYEIDGTCDDITLNQWIEFCLSAQQMAWNDRNRNEILSAATYSSEDPYMRTTAYIVAEALNTDVAPLNNPTFYNPYADEEKFERLHVKTAKALYDDILHQIKDDEKGPERLLERAEKQNQALYSGQIVGWCAPALIKTCHTMNKADTRPEMVRDVFLKTLEGTSWKEIKKLGRFIMLQKRQGIEITPKLILNSFIANNENRQVFKEAFDTP